MMFIGILIGLALSYTYCRFNSSANKDIIESRLYFDYSRSATEKYNELSTLFSSNRDKVKLISLKFVSANSMLNWNDTYVIIAKYKFLDDTFKIHL